MKYTAAEYLRAWRESQFRVWCTRPYVEASEWRIYFHALKGLRYTADDPLWTLADNLIKAHGTDNWIAQVEAEEKLLSFGEEHGTTD